MHVRPFCSANVRYVKVTDFLFVTLAECFIVTHDPRFSSPRQKITNSSTILCHHVFIV
jgi:hypothetical protein